MYLQRAAGSVQACSMKPLPNTRPRILDLQASRVNHASGYRNNSAGPKRRGNDCIQHQITVPERAVREKQLILQFLGRVYSVGDGEGGS